MIDSGTVSAWFLETPRSRLKLRHPSNRMRTRRSYLLLGLAALVVMLGTAAWLLGSLAELHDRFSRQSRELGIAFLIVLIVFLVFATFWVGRLLWVSRKTGEQPRPGAGRRDRGRVGPGRRRPRA